MTRLTKQRKKMDKNNWKEKRKKQIMKKPCECWIRKSEQKKKKKRKKWKKTKLDINRTNK